MYTLKIWMRHDVQINQVYHVSLIQKLEETNR